ncbi:MAG: prepilin-type N-terminal cleavage/methylation domain-containing protein [Clostridiales bacterium]|nr:prepilin-type N-terminal cleavage/methylation domain-containing protein [Clostridiales bacterium]
MFFKAKKKKGVTLIEVLASLAILALLIIPIANLVINSSSTAKRSQDKQKAYLAGQSVLEQIGNIDNSKEIDSYDLEYTNMSGDLVTGDKISFPKGSDAVTSELSNVGNARYKMFVTLKKELTNESPEERKISVDTGEDFMTKYPQSALALQLSKTSESAPIDVYNPNDPTRSYSFVNNESKGYVIYIASDGTCDLYEDRNYGTGSPEIGTKLMSGIGTINNSYNKLRIYLAGNKKLNTSNGTVPSIPLSGNLNLSVVSDYAGINDLEVEVTKGEDVSTILSMPVKLGDSVPGSIHVNEYSAEGDLSKKIGDLYKVTVEVRPINGKDAGDDIFSGSTTCNVLVK